MRMNDQVNHEDKAPQKHRFTQSIQRLTTNTKTAHYIRLGAVLGITVITANAIAGPQSARELAASTTAQVAESTTRFEPRDSALQSRELATDAPEDDQNTSTPPPSEEHPNAEVYVNDEKISVPANGRVRERLDTEDEDIHVDVKIDSKSSSSDNSHDNSSVDINISTKSSSTGDVDVRSRDRSSRRLR